ncbi:MAG TPA: Crp/Fnr family transcriptional regulator [Bacteroidales bacterium]|nr:Crp/Fnr family transcriptional regulator [Bacteroidales bacterium]
MKFNKNINCDHCQLKCDIYQALQDSTDDFSCIKPLHVHYERHEYICKQGSPVSHAIYLVDGSAKLFIEGLNNRNITLYIMKPKTYIGLLSFFETPYYSYSVKALENSQICMIDLDCIKKLYINNHNFLLKLNKAFGKSVSSILSKIITLNQKNIRGRIADSLLYLSDLYKSDSFEMLLSRKELGELSAISEENAVRILSEFRKEGIIDVKGKRISILDRNLITKISEVG